MTHALGVLPIGPSLANAGGAVAAVAISLVSFVIALSTLLYQRRTGKERASPVVVAAITLGTLLMLVVTFVVIQPLLWRAVFTEEPPRSTTDIGNVIGVLLTMASLAAGGIGVLLFKVIEYRATAIRTETEEKFTRQLKVIRASQWANLGYLSWLNYEQAWREAGYSEEATERPSFQAFLESAISTTETAVELYGTIPEPIRPSTHVVAKRNLAYHLATRRRPEDGPRALKLLAESGTGSKDDSSFVETVAWVYQRSSKDEQKKADALENLRQALQGDVSDDWRRAVIDRYRAVFDIDLDVD